MALFSSKKTETDEQDNVQNTGGWSDNTRSDVLVRPLITEKATHLTNDNVFTFVVKKSANKPAIKQAIKDVYDVGVKKVRTVNLPTKKVESRHGNPGTKGGVRKAYVTLSDGDSIDLM